MMTRSNAIKLGFTGFWGFCIAAVFLGWMWSDVEMEQIPAIIHVALSDFGLFNAALVYVALYALRPLVLFPAGFMTVAAGLIFGPWLGILVTVVGENLSANITFVIARWVGRDWVQAHESERLAHWDERLRHSALMSVLVMRLILLPFDAVNIVCALTGMRQRDYVIGTFLGIAPSLISFVLLGGAGAAGVQNRPVFIGGSVVLFVLGFVLARWLHSVSPDRPVEPDSSFEAAPDPVSK